MLKIKLKMRYLLFIITAISLTFFSCDDGDIIDVKLDFDDTFNSCEETDLVLFKIKNIPSESLSIFIPDFSLQSVFNIGQDNTFSVTRLGTFNYRIYANESIDGTNLFCNLIPDSSISITQDFSSACSVLIETLLIEDDNDGIAAEFENQDPNGDGDFSDAQDTDNDGIPDYLDVDDDGDNVLTVNENPDPNQNGIFDDAQDTDNDGTPDYLDLDDDGDGIPTRDEESDSQDLNPANDRTNSDIGPDYLNAAVADNTVPKATAFRVHTIQQEFEVKATVFGISIDILSQDELDFGFLSGNGLTSTRTGTPNFN